jgi:hypothetical protein
MKRLTPFLFVLLLAACNGPTGSTSAVSSHASSRMTSDDMRQTYTNDKDGYSIKHPNDWNIVENYLLTAQDYTATGSAIEVPPQQNTTLNEAKFHIAKTPGACPVVKDSTTVTINGYKYRKSDWTGVGAGNLYEGTLYSFNYGQDCYRITFYAHSCNLAPEDCGPNHPLKYDKRALWVTFRKMLETFEVKK